MALRDRVGRHSRGADAQVFQADWLEWLKCKAAAVPERGQVPFSAMESLSQRYRRLDILMTIQHGLGIRWNLHQYLPSEESAADRFAGSSDWRSKAEAGEDGCAAIISTFVGNMASRLGFSTRKWQLVRNNSGGALYYLCLFSRHPRALEFWDKVGLKDEQGQRAMEF